MDDYLQSKKQLWALTHDITIKGQPVELYAQDYTDPFREGQGIYSLESHKWAQKPTKYSINRSHPEVVRKVKEWMDIIDTLIDSKSDDKEAFKNIKNRLKGMRAMPLNVAVVSLAPRIWCLKSSVTVVTWIRWASTSVTWKMKIFPWTK